MSIARREGKEILRQAGARLVQTGLRRRAHPCNSHRNDADIQQRMDESSRFIEQWAAGISGRRSLGNKACDQAGDHQEQDYLSNSHVDSQGHPLGRLVGQTF